MVDSCVGCKHVFSVTTLTVISKKITTELLLFSQCNTINIGGERNNKYLSYIAQTGQQPKILCSKFVCCL